MTQLQPAVWTRYAAIGDSFTEGMCDDDPAMVRDSEFAGWADRLAVMLAEQAAQSGEQFGYANLAVRGRLLADIVGPQLDSALALSPDLVSIVGGGNDILRPKADIDALADQLETAVVRIRETGADVLLCTPADPSGAPLVGRATGRMASYACHIWSIGRRHGCAVTDMWGLRALKDWRMWAEDRIHLSSEGHRRLALAAYEALGFDTDRDDWTAPLDPTPPRSRKDRLTADAQWAKEYVGPWVHRRLTGRSSGDTVQPKRPDVTPLD